MKINPSAFRRNVVLDIETVGPVPDGPKAALSALTGRIVYICLLVDDGSELKESALIDSDERTIVSGFWDVVRASDVFLGHTC